MDDALSVRPGFQPWRALFRSSVYSMTLRHTQVLLRRTVTFLPPGRIFREVLVRRLVHDETASPSVTNCAER